MTTNSESHLVNRNKYLVSISESMQMSASPHIKGAMRHAESVSTLASEDERDYHKMGEKRIASMNGRISDNWGAIHSHLKNNNPTEAKAHFRSMPKAHKEAYDDPDDKDRNDFHSFIKAK